MKIDELKLCIVEWETLTYHNTLDEISMELPFLNSGAWLGVACTQWAQSGIALGNLSLHLYFFFHLLLWLFVLNCAVSLSQKLNEQVSIKIDSNLTMCAGWICTQYVHHNEGIIKAILMHHNCPLLSLLFICHFCLLLNLFHLSLIRCEMCVCACVHSDLVQMIWTPYNKLINAIVCRVWSKHHIITIYCSTSFRTVDWVVAAVSGAVAYHFIVVFFLLPF